MSLYEQYPFIAPCIPSASNVVQKLRENPEYELEARFGKIKNGKFIPGVERVVMDEIIEMMQKSTFVKCEDEWKEEMDLYFTYNDRQLRTRVQYDSNSMNVTPQTTEKKLITQPCDYKHQFIDHEGDLNVRLSLKSEKDIKIPPLSTNPHLVRIKQRKRFVTENKIWAFDFSMTWSGKSKSEAELSQMNDEAIFEIECECIDTSVLDIKNDTYIATSILLKMYDFLPKGSILIPK